MPLHSIVLRGRGAAQPWEIDDSARRALYVQEGDHCRRASAEEAIEYTQQLIAERFRYRSPLPAPQELKQLLQVLFAPRHQMTFAALFLDSRGRVIELAELFEGTVDRVCIHIREIARDIFERNAASIIFVRSDPSGCTHSTEHDVRQCEYLREALAFIEVGVLDYLIVAAEEVISLAERGWTSESSRVPCAAGTRCVPT